MRASFPPTPSPSVSCGARESSHPLPLAGATVVVVITHRAAFKHHV